MWVLALGQKDLLQKNTVSQYSTLAWEISWGEEPGGLQSMEGQRVGHDLATEHGLCLHTLQLCRHISSLLEKAMASHSSILAWKIPWTEEPGRLQSMGSWRVGHDWATSLSLFTFMHWRRKWQPTPVFSPGESQGWRSLMGCCLWGCTELDTTEVTWQQAAASLVSNGPCLVPFLNFGIFIFSTF